MKKYMKYIGLMLAAALVCGCSAQTEATVNSYAEKLGIDVSAGDYEEVVDTHGGFHGDGVTFAYITFSDDSLAGEIEEAEGWNALPMDENVTALIYGVTKVEGNSVYSNGPYITSGDGQPLIPRVENGWYYFADRQSEGNIHDSSQVLERASINCTVAVYDSDNEKLYYLELDT